MNKTIYLIIIGLVVITGVVFYRLNDRNVPASTPTPAVLNNATKSYSMEEVAKHNSAEDCWMVINNHVVNVTDFIASGGHNQEITRGCGIDATIFFEQERKHRGGEAQSLFEQFTIGILQM